MGGTKTELGQDEESVEERDEDSEAGDEDNESEEAESTTEEDDAEEVEVAEGEEVWETSGRTGIAKCL